MTTGVVLWALPLLLVSLWPHPVTAFVAVALLGLGNPLVDVNMDTIFQRIAPDEVLGRVFGALETCLITTMALGAALMPILVSWLGLRAGLAVVGIGVTAGGAGRAAADAQPRRPVASPGRSRPAGVDTDVHAPGAGGAGLPGSSADARPGDGRRRLRPEGRPRTASTSSSRGWWK